MADILSWHRRHAMMLASQLPEGTEDSVIILKLAMELVGFLGDRTVPARPNIVPFKGDTCD